MLDHIRTSLSPIFFILYIFQCVRTMVVSTMVVLHLRKMASFKQLTMFQPFNHFTIIVRFHWCDLFDVHIPLSSKVLIYL
jgi:hypothetical protein